jgi:hypothetical protein
MQINASKSKEMQGRLLLFPCIPFADSGLFNGLRRKKIKNFSWILSRSLVVFKAPRGARKRPIATPLLDSAHMKYNSRSSLFQQGNSVL